MTKPAITAEKIHDIIQNRWSPRAFDASKTITEDVLHALLEAARWAPSCMNEQPWRFLVCNKAQNEASWESLLGCLAEKNQQWAMNAPLLLMAVAMNTFNQNQKPNRWAAYDTGAASLNLCLQATAMGLVTHQMGGFDTDQCIQRFNLPDGCTPLSVIAVGYQSDIDCLNDEFKQRELAERSRAALTERFYFGCWG
ncbi:MAG: nitroreductase [Methylomonas sp.]|nr:MAG: nitroreductase [Methylomonas sp.]